MEKTRKALTAQVDIGRPQLFHGNGVTTLFLWMTALVCHLYAVPEITQCQLVDGKNVVAVLWKENQTVSLTCVGLEKASGVEWRVENAWFFTTSIITCPRLSSSSSASCSSNIDSVTAVRDSGTQSTLTIVMVPVLKIMLSQGSVTCKQDAAALPCTLDLIMSRAEASCGGKLTASNGSPLEPCTLRVHCNVRGVSMLDMSKCQLLHRRKNDAKDKIVVDWVPMEDGTNNSQAHCTMTFKPVLNEDEQQFKVRLMPGFAQVPVTVSGFHVCPSYLETTPSYLETTQASASARAPYLESSDNNSQIALIGGIAGGIILFILLLLACLHFALYRYWLPKKIRQKARALMKKKKRRRKGRGKSKGRKSNKIGAKLASSSTTKA